jgi:hypothetical protein
MSKEEDGQSEDRIPEWERAIATYRQAWLDLVHLGVVLLDSDQDLLRLKETVDGMTEVQAKELLTTSAALAAQENIELRRRSRLN